MQPEDHVKQWPRTAARVSKLMEKFLQNLGVKILIMALVVPSATVK